MKNLVVLVAALVTCSLSCEIPDTLEESWGYVDVRPKAHQFWWFMKTPCSSANERPIIIWLQGGPGGSGTGYGNFMEIGPLDNNLIPRNYTWLKQASLIFIDSPVGAGFSYVDDESAFTTTVYEVADDLVVTLGQVSEKLKAEHYNGSTLPPIFIFSESYGGKVAPVFGAKIVAAQKYGLLPYVTLGGVAIGDGAVSLVDAANAYPDMLFQTSQIDLHQFQQLSFYTKVMQYHYDIKDYDTASRVLGMEMEAIVNMTDEVFFYNIRYHHQPSPSLKENSEHLRRTIHRFQDMMNGKSNPSKTDMKNIVKSLAQDSAPSAPSTPFQRLNIDYNGENVKKMMNTEIRKKFGIIPDDVIWGAQAIDCHTYLSDEMIIDVIDSVDECLASGVRVVVYNGMLDLIINSVGQDMWISRLKWPDLPNYYKSAKRIPLYPPSLAKEKRTGAFHKAYKNFEYYWVLMSGHMVPIDAPEMSLEMVRRIVGGEKFEPLNI